MRRAMAKEPKSVVDLGCRGAAPPEPLRRSWRGGCYAIEGVSNKRGLVDRGSTNRVLVNTMSSQLELDLGHSLSADVRSIQKMTS